MYTSNACILARNVVQHSSPSSTECTPKKSRGRGLVGLPFLAYGKSSTKSQKELQPNISPGISGIVQSTPPASLTSGQETTEQLGIPPTPSDVDTFTPANDDSSFTGSSVALVDLNTTLTQTMVSPLVKTDLPKKNVVQSKLHRSTGYIQDKFQRAMDSPVPLERKTCEDCKVLLKDFKSRYPELKNRRDKYLLLTCAPRNYSRISSNAQENRLVQHPVTKEVTREQTRRMILNLRELHAEFCRIYPDVAVRISKFASLRPVNCKWPGNGGMHNVCTCHIHENFRFLLEAFNQTRDFGAVIRSYLCSTPGKDCYMGWCSECPNFQSLERLEELVGGSHVQFLRWECTERTNIFELSESSDDFKRRFQKEFRTTAAHHFTMCEQQNYISTVKENLKNERSIMITCLKKKTYMVVSDHLEHVTSTFHVFRSKVLQELKKEDWFRNITKIYYVSDGAASQYKNYKNFCNLYHHFSEYNIYAEWIFTATAHGKSECDAACGVLKRMARTHSLKGHLITTIDALYTYCRTLITDTRTFLLVTTEAISSQLDALDLRYSMAKSIPGTRTFHSFQILNQEGVLRCRYFSNDFTYIDFAYSDMDETVPAAFKVGQYVAVKKSCNFMIGVILSIDQDKSDVGLTIKPMKRNGKQNQFQWYTSDVQEYITKYDIISAVSVPTPSSSSGRFYKLSIDDYNHLTTV
ncbi:unnamed protein product [Allacma fusca]|uniref:Uncharacterized protein n=1 Tax=Allacma fusca TaxID=39272 RepID=A0A8J2LFF2_9HEXA|nr:unnamed protein product [Allacma fusca]